MQHQDIINAAQHLSGTDRGRKALAAMADALPNMTSLDSLNQQAAASIIKGFFGDFTGTALDVVRRWKKEPVPASGGCTCTRDYDDPMCPEHGFN